MPLLYYDNTRISTYRDCNRRFYLRHVLDLTTDTIKIDLVFGLAWHEAMNVVWDQLHKRTPEREVHKLAVATFIQKWVEEGLMEPTADNYQIITDKWEKKNPWVAMEMLDNYIQQRKAFIYDCEEVDCERPFAVPLGLQIPITSVTLDGQPGPTTLEEVFYIGRLDKAVKHKQHGRLIIEHKTTGSYAKEGGFRSDYLESFSPNSQIDGYLFAGNSLYEGGVKGVWVDAALTHKTVHDKFKFIPVDRMLTMLDQWLAETRIWVQRITDELNTYEQADPAVGKAFAYFPKNTGSCGDYSGCVYRDVCKYIGDPWRVGVPSGFRVEKWEPFDLLKIGEIMQRVGD
jgi:hypothetical protein